ncbi:9342_t:CDS:1, partial [Rhizophagus irregularis]
MIINGLFDRITSELAGTFTTPTKRSAKANRLDLMLKQITEIKYVIIL